MILVISIGLEPYPIGSEIILDFLKILANPNMTSDKTSYMICDITSDMTCKMTYEMTPDILYDIQHDICWVFWGVFNDIKSNTTSDKLSVLISNTTNCVTFSHLNVI